MKNTRTKSTTEVSRTNPVELSENVRAPAVLVVNELGQKGHPRAIVRDGVWVATELGSEVWKTSFDLRPGDMIIALREGAHYRSNAGFRTIVEEGMLTFMNPGKYGEHGSYQE